MADMKEKISHHKEEGLRHVAKGNWEKALREFNAVQKISPQDPYILLKIGDCCAKLGRVDDAIRSYDLVSKIYDREGFVVKAIAVNKLILKFRPNSPEIEARLSALYTSKISAEGPTPAIKSPEVKDIESYPRSPLFADLSREEFMAVVQIMQPVEAAEGDIVVREHDEGDSIFIIASGEVMVFRSDGAGNELWISTLLEGDFFGEFGYFSESRRSVSVKAIKDSTFLVISGADLDVIIDRHPKVKDVLLLFYKERVLDTLLAISPIFSSLLPGERKLLLPYFSPVVFKQGAVILEEGEVGDRMYFIKSGEVSVITKKGDKSIRLATLKPGDFFGEVSVITGKPRTATVIATKNSVLVELTKDKIQDVITIHPEILDTLNTYIAKRVEDTIATMMQYKNRIEESGLV